MAYQLPEYILEAKINDPVINYQWDDRNIDAVLDCDAARPFIDKLENVGLRAKIALAIGIHEWIVGRFNGLSTDRLSYQVAEAAWCANVDVNYVTYLELNPYDFIGPIEGALFVSMNALLPVLYVSDNVYDVEDEGNRDPQYYYNPDEWKECLSTLIPLALHIMPEPAVFEEWLNGVIERLVENYTQPEPDPFENLFGQDNNETLLGDYVPVEVLDLTVDFDKNQTVPLLNQYLAMVDRRNPLLLPLQELEKVMATPFYIDESNV